MNVHAVDLRDELRKGVQLRFGSSPIVVRRPVADELFERRELHALCPIRDELLGWQARGREPPAKFSKVLLRHVDPERPDRGPVVFDSGQRRRGRADRQKHRCGHGDHHAPDNNPVSQSFEWRHACLLASMTPETTGGIYCTNVWATPSYRSAHRGDGEAMAST